MVITKLLVSIFVQSLSVISNFFTITTLLYKNQLLHLSQHIYSYTDDLTTYKQNPHFVLQHTLCRVDPSNSCIFAKACLAKCLKLPTGLPLNYWTSVSIPFNCNPLLVASWILWAPYVKLYVSDIFVIKRYTAFIFRIIYDDFLSIHHSLNIFFNL